MRMDEAQRALARRVAEAREKRKWTQQQVADAAGVSLGTVNNFEREVSWPQKKKREAILRALDLDASGSAELPQAQNNGDGNGSYPICEKCGRVVWPRSYEVLFDMLGAYLDTLPPARQDELFRNITRGILTRQL